MKLKHLLFVASTILLVVTATHVAVVQGFELRLTLLCLLVAATVGIIAYWSPGEPASQAGKVDTSPEDCPEESGEAGPPSAERFSQAAPEA